MMNESTDGRQFGGPSSIQLHEWKIMSFSCTGKIKRIKQNVIQIPFVEKHYILK
jgi:hypothetical protein